MRPLQRYSIAALVVAGVVAMAEPAAAQPVFNPDDPLNLGDTLDPVDEVLRGSLDEADGDATNTGEDGGAADGAAASTDRATADVAPSAGARRRTIEDTTYRRAGQPQRDGADETDGERPEFVADRRRDELEPIGLRAGSFIIHPEVETAVEATDNVFSTSAGRTADVLFVARPRLRARSDWTRHEVAFGYEGEYGAYVENPSENPNQTAITGSARLDVTRRTALAANGRFAIEQEGRGDADVPTNSTSPTMRRAYGAAGEASHRFNRLTAALRGGIEFADYENGTDSTGAVVDNSDRDQSETSAGGRLTYEVSPATSVYVDGEMRRRRYVRDLDDAGFARDADRITALAGFAFEPTPLVEAEASVGVVSEVYEDARLASIAEVVANASLAWAVTPLTTLRGGFTTEVDATTVAGASASVSRTVTAGIDHELLRNLVIKAEGSFEWVDYPGIPLHEETVTASLGGEYWLTRNAALTMGFEHETQITHDGTGNVVEDVVAVGLRLRR